MKAALAALGRATANATPWLIGASVIAGVIVLTSSGRDRARDRRSFLREVAMNPAFTPEHFVFFRAAEKPIADALRMIANPETVTPVREALRRAVAGVL